MDVLLIIIVALIFLILAKMLFICNSVIKNRNRSLSEYTGRKNELIKLKQKRYERKSN